MASRLKGGLIGSSEEPDREHTPTPTEARLIYMLDGSLPVQPSQKSPEVLPAALKSAARSSSLKKKSKVLPRRGVPIVSEKGVPIESEKVIFASPVAEAKESNLAGIKKQKTSSNWRGKPVCFG